MRLPQFLLVEDSDADAEAFVALIKRIGLINAVRACSTVAEAQRYLAAAETAGLPVVVFSGGSVADGEGEDLFAWMEDQESLCAIPTVSLDKPLEMYAIIGALKALALPERARVDTTTLMVRVELWPHGTILADS